MLDVFGRREVAACGGRNGPWNHCPFARNRIAILDDRDAILRVFRLGPTELATSTPRAVDGATVVNGRSPALSEGRVFFRTPEGGSAPETTVQAGPLSSDLFPQRVSLSADWRYVAFATSDHLSGPLPVADGNALHDVYVPDLVAIVLVRARRDAGQLRLKADLPLSSYDSEPVTVRIDDTDSQPIAQQAMGTLPPKGASGERWQFSTKAPGVQKVQLRLKPPGIYRLLVKSKRWFQAADADQSAANTRVTVSIGTQCFARAATVKVD